MNYDDLRERVREQTRDSIKRRIADQKPKKEPEQ